MKRQKNIEQLFNTMSQLRKLMMQQTQETHEERTATMLQFATLTFLKSNKKSTISDVADFMKLSKSSTTQLIERLVKAGTVQRIPDQEDRRIVRLAVTEAGEQEIINLKKKFLNKINKVFSKIPDQDLEELIRIHIKLIETLQTDQKK